MIFAERRLAVILSVFMLSVFLLCVLEYKFITAAAIVSGLLTVAFIVLRVILAKIYKYKNKIKTLCGFALMFVSAVTAAILFCILHYNLSEKPVLDYLDKYKDTPVYIKAEIKNASSLTFMSSFDLKVFEVDGEKTKKFNLSLVIFGEIGVDSDEIDNILETWVIFKNLEDDIISNSSVAYYKSGGYYIAADHFAGNSAESGGIGAADDEDENEANPLSYKITTVKSHSLTYYLHSMRSYAKDIFFGNIKRDYHDTKTQEAATVYGIFTGNKNDINPTVKADFKKSGISHVLAVSGLHLSILCGIIFLFLNSFKVHKKISCIMIISCCLSFMAFTGFSLSVMRSGIMTVLFYAAFLIGRKSDSATSLLAAGTFITLLNPHNILNIGFQLSFAATLGIVSTANLNNRILSKLNNIKRFKRFKFLLKLLGIILSSFIVTISATVFTLPFISYSFKTLSLISPVTNLVTSPLITAILFLALCIMIFSFIPVILPVLSIPAYLITKLLLAVTNHLGSVKYAYISVESTNANGAGFYIFAVIFLISIILCFLIPPMSAKKFVKPVVYSTAILAFVILCAALIYPRMIFKDSVRFAYYSDDKNQNMILFQDYDSVDIIDITYGAQAHIKPTFDIMIENGAAHINSIILTHYHKRHAQMIRKYISYSEIKKVYIPAPADDYDIEVFNSLYYLSVSENFELIKYNDSLKLNNVLITVNTFDYNKMRHMTVDIDIDCRLEFRSSNENVRRKLLYLGIGYREGYAEHTDINEKDYDIIFYGSHKHNRRDDDYVASLSGSYAGVLSYYFDANKNKAAQKLDASALEAYLSGSRLFKSDDYHSIVLEIKKDGGIKCYLR